ncbi:MAG: amino acid adenylation domain-containing protein, partial [Bacteroidota bacterium]
EERIHYMLSDSRSAVLVDDALLNKFEQVKDKYAVDNPSAFSQASDLAYVIYTSGSTGNPKGVQIEHRNVVRLLKNEEDLFDFAATDVWTVFHSYCFDFSVWEMYGALLFGGKLVVVPKETAQNPALFYQLLVQQKVTVLNQTPSYFSNLIGQAMKQPDADLALRYVIFGGEALQPTSLHPWRVKYPQVRLINMYGITETTVHVTYKEITEKEIASGISDIGQPIPTLSCLVLDNHRQLVPRGVPGEMYIGGAGLARAYLNRPALTKERFIAHPFAPGQRLYRSGDVARIQMSGDLQYMGRNDHQVKVRGYRIETAEIERHLYKIKAIKSCIVLAHANESGDAELIAYYSLSEPLSSRDIRSQLKTSLPAYMLPTHLMEMEELALTKNGKIDRKALPLPGEREVAAEGPLELPQGVVEETLLKLWQEVLRNERIAVLDDFFSIGGDSIKILRLNSGIQESLGLTIPLIELYKHTSIRQQAQFIEEQSDQLQQFRQRQQERESEVNDIFLSIKRAALEQLPQEEAEKIEDVFPMTAIEQGMVFESLIHQGEAIYHDQFVYPQNFTDFRFETFGKALQHMVEKHAILRTTFEPYRFGEAVQIVWKKTTASFGQHDLSALSNADQEHAIGAFMQTRREQPFDLQNGPLWRMDVFAISDSQYIFVWQFHHAILDGWSNASFITELNNLYFRLLEQVDHQPPKLAATYRDFALQQYQDSRDESLIDFWKKELASYTRLDLFRTDVCQENVLLQLDVQSIQSLEALSARVKISERSICLAAFLYLFRILCNENDVLIGLVTNGRPDKKDGDKILGCFLNSLPLKMPIDDQWTCREFIEAVDRKLVSLKKGERLSTFDIARALGETADHSQNPFFDLLFNFVDFHTYENVVYEEQGTEASDKNAVFVDPHEATNTHMDCSISRTGGGFSLSIRLARQLRSEHTAKEIGERFLQILRSFLQQADSPLSEVEYLREEERQTLLQTFNDTAQEYPRDKTIVDLFFEQAAKYPDHQALFCDGRTLSYTELNELSNQLAHHLREVHGFQKGDLCAIYLPLSDWLIASILGILKAGGIFLPIDTLYPQERVDYMLEDSQAALLIDEEFWHSFYQQKDQFSTANPEQHTTARDLAYVIYTSGSTGNPKGVMVEHQPVVNLIFWHHKYYGTTCEDRATRLLSPSFDASLWETFPYLMCGACLYIVPQDIRLDIPRLNDFFIRHQITIGFLPTPLFEQWEFDDRHSLRCILTGGDSLTIIPESSPTVYNNYGPTENGIVTSS